jgi:16S rRNA processing protein RimM
MTANRLVVIGRAVKPFGIRGEVKIRPFTETFLSFENSAVLVFDQTPYEVEKLRIHKGAVLALLRGVETPERARLLAGALVKTDEKNLPPKEENEYFWFELIGLEVTSADGRMLGKITNIIETGAADVLQVEGPSGEVLIPMIEGFVKEIDTKNGRMIVDPPEGLIPDD